MTQFVIATVVMFAIVAAAGRWASSKQRRLAQEAEEINHHQNQEVGHARNHR